MFVLFIQQRNNFDQITQQKIIEPARIDFTTTNKDRYAFWVIDNPKEVQLIAEAFKEVDSIYMADGHHRSASSALMGEELKSKPQIIQEMNL